MTLALKMYTLASAHTVVGYSFHIWGAASENLDEVNFSRDEGTVSELILVGQMKCIHPLL